MSADLAPALALAEKYGIALDLIDGNRLHSQSGGPTPDAALKAAKGELIDLLVRFRLDAGSLLKRRPQAPAATSRASGRWPEAPSGTPAKLLPALGQI
jgi:hypothetical protein